MSFQNLASFYISKEWRNFRQTVINERLARDGDIICNHCNKPIMNSYEIIAHHCNIFLTEQNVFDYDISLNPDNIQLVHMACHNKIHLNFGNSFRKVFIVFGSPAAGKSTFVNEAASPDDLIVDIDRIYEAINNNRSKKLYTNVMKIFNDLIDSVKTRQGQWRNAYIVLANCRNVERFQRMLDAEVIHISTAKEVCYERAEIKINKYGESYKDYLDQYWNEWDNTYSQLLKDLIQ